MIPGKKEYMAKNIQFSCSRYSCEGINDVSCVLKEKRERNKRKRSAQDNKNKEDEM